MIISWLFSTITQNSSGGDGKIKEDNRLRCALEAHSRDSSVDESIYIANHVVDGQYFLENPQRARALKTRATQPNVLSRRDPSLRDRFAFALKDAIAADDYCLLEMMGKKVQCEMGALEEELAKIEDPAKLDHSLQVLKERYLSLLQKLEQY